MGSSLRVVLVDWQALAAERARVSKWHSIAVPDAWCVEYPALSYVGAGKDFLWLSLIWDHLRDGLEPGARERFDEFFRRISWNPGDYTDSTPDEDRFYCDIRVDFADARSLVLGPDTIAVLLGWWRDDLVHRWETLRPGFDAYLPGRFRDFAELTAFVVRWLDAFDAAARADRGLIGAYT